MTPKQVDAMITLNENRRRHDQELQRLNAFAICVSGFGSKITSPDKMYTFWWEDYETEYSDQEYSRIKSPEQWDQLDRRYEGKAKESKTGIKDLPEHIRNKYFGNRL